MTLWCDSLFRLVKQRTERGFPFSLQKSASTDFSSCRQTHQVHILVNTSFLSKRSGFLFPHCSWKAVWEHDCSHQNPLISRPSAFLGTLHLFILLLSGTERARGQTWAIDPGSNLGHKPLISHSFLLGSAFSCN